jgi:transcription-repair coupling factor (superfamily II helicase)
VPDVDTRVTLYARLARITETAELDAFERELEDRFGAAPDDGRRLLALARLRLQARALDVERIDAGPAGIALTPRGDAEALAKELGLAVKNGRVFLAERIEDPAARLDRLAALFRDTLD